jgi:uncharacterized protein
MKSEYPVRIDRSVKIPMRDGVYLSADLIRPDSPGRFPAILEYIPYRKDDHSRLSLGWHDYFAQRGFVGVRLDVRGTGGSQGINTDEYMPQEQEDGYDAVEWLAAQPWCNGSVGMFGASYGGFTAIQVAMKQPPHLKAIVPLYATDDRYTDDCHYTQGGNLRMYYDIGVYGGFMAALNALPPYPELAGDDWATLWTQRLEKNEPYLPKWLHHQVDGPYWRHGSLRPDYDQVRCPVFLVAGWRDGYANPMLRMFERLKTPRKLMMGPWVHVRPHTSIPGPRIDFFHEVLRFFDFWLNGNDNGVMQEPAVTTYMQEYSLPERTADVTPGHWRCDESFPVAGAHEQTFFLRRNGLLGQSVDPSTGMDALEYMPALGTGNGYWSGGGISFYLPDDQRADEAYSLVYTTTPLNEETHILGWPKVILHAASSARAATFVAKLSDVAPDGHSALIVDGSLNATRRHSFSEPEALVPEEIYELRIPMMPTGWVVKPGHCLRLAISGSDFPNLWPSPEAAINKVYRGGQYPSRLTIPIVPKSVAESPQFSPPPPLREIVKTQQGPMTQQVVQDQISGITTVLRRSRITTVLDDNLGIFSYQQEMRCSASARNPAQASVVASHTYTQEREDGVTETCAESTLRSTQTAFHLTIQLNVTRNGKPFFQKHWAATEPRRLL